MDEARVGSAEEVFHAKSAKSAKEEVDDEVRKMGSEKFWGRVFRSAF
jgi:hypothetical protein